MGIKKPSASSTPSTSTGSATALAPSRSWSRRVLGSDVTAAVDGPRASRPHAGQRPAVRAPLAVYIHWPFCRSKCPYCDFNSHVRDSVDAARWTRALMRDLGHQADLTVGRAVGSVFFGGGTPSLMPPETVAVLLDGVRSHWGVVPDIEITLEANPN